MPASTGLPFRFSTPLVTERLVLRLMTVEDVDALYAYQSRADVCRYLPFEPRTRDEVAEKVAKHSRAVTLAADHDYLALAVTLRGPDGAEGPLIGDSYFRIASVEHARGEIGWAMHPDHLRRGYAAEAAAAMLDLAFSTLGLHRVYAELDVRNDASIALCRRLGMREEAYFVQDMMFKGEWVDTGIYALLVDEWRAADQASADAGRPAGA